MTKFITRGIWLSVLIAALGAGIICSAQPTTVAAVPGNCVSGAVQAAVQGLNSSNYLHGIIPFCSVQVYLTGTVTPAVIYANGTQAPLSNPFTAKQDGSWVFWAAPGQGYDVVLSGGIPPNTYSVAKTINNVFALTAASTTPAVPGGSDNHLQFNNNGVFGGAAGISTLDGLSLRIQGASITKSGPFACAEWYLSSADGQGGTDYGFAINAADQAASLTQPSTIKLCLPGQHPIFTTAMLDRPIALDGTGAALVPQSTLASTPVTTTATFTLGSSSITVSSAVGLVAGQAIYGVGLPSANVIASTYTSGNTVPLALPTALNVVGVPVVTGTYPTLTPNTQICGIAHMDGLAAGQSITGFGVPAATTIASLQPAGISGQLGQCITVSQNLTAVKTIATTTTPVVQPVAFSLGGTLSGVAVTAVTTTPVIRWQYNSGALHDPPDQLINSQGRTVNSEGQMIGGSMRGIYIVDTGNGGAGRSLSGVQGVQMYAWDRMKVDDFQVENLNGAALILGGYNTPNNNVGGVGLIREAQFHDLDLRDSGDPSTGQSTLEIMDPPASGDRTNQVRFTGTQIVFPYAEGITIGSYRTPPSPAPGLIWFGDNTQIEGGNHTPNQMVQAPFDLVGIQNGNDIHFAHAEMLGPGYGRADIRADNVYSVSVIDSVYAVNFKGPSYNVSYAAGGSALTFVSQSAGGTDTGFIPAAQLNGYGAVLTDAGSCTSGCPVWLTATGSVSADRHTMNLTGNPSTATSGVIQVGGGGYYLINNLQTNAFGKSTITANSYGDMAGSRLARLGLSNASQLAWAGTLPLQNFATDNPSLGAYFLYGSVFTGGINFPINLNVGAIKSSGSLTASNGFVGDFIQNLPSTTFGQNFLNQGTGTTSNMVVTAKSVNGTLSAYDVVISGASWRSAVGACGVATTWGLLDTTTPGGHCPFRIAQGAVDLAVKVEGAADAVNGVLDMNQGARIGGGSYILAEYKGSGTLTYTSITAPGCQEQPLTINNAAPGDQCSASTGVTDIGPATFWYGGCRVQTANTALIKVCAAATGTPTAAVWTGWVRH